MRYVKLGFGYFLVANAVIRTVVIAVYLLAWLFASGPVNLERIPRYIVLALGCGYWGMELINSAKASEVAAGKNLDG